MDQRSSGPGIQGAPVPTKLERSYCGWGEAVRDSNDSNSSPKAKDGLNYGAY